jgi:hypothetical protein
VHDLRVEPERVRVTTRGEVLITVHGRGFGRLRVGGERRWVRGRFSQSFLLSKHVGSVEIEARWWFGRRTWSLSLAPVVDLRVPRIAAAAYRDPADSRRAPVPAPCLRLPRLSAPVVPRRIALQVRRELEVFERSNKT